MRSFAIHKQFNAFTLLELLVGMIVSGIVLTATFSAYHIITRQYETFNTRSTSDAEISFFVSQLESDFANAENRVRISEHEIQLQSEKRMLEYSFSEKRVLRNDFMRMDTFNVSIREIETYWKSKKTNLDNSPIDELHVMLNIDGKKVEKIFSNVRDAKTEIDNIEIDLK